MKSANTQKVAANKPTALSKLSLRRIAHRSGICEVSEDAIERIRKRTHAHTQRLLRLAIIYADNSSRLTVSAEDVGRAVNFLGCSLYA